MSSLRRALPLAALIIGLPCQTMAADAAGSGATSITADEAKHCETESVSLRMAEQAVSAARNGGYQTDEWERRARDKRTEFESCVEQFRVRDKANKEALKEEAARIQQERQQAAEVARVRQAREAQVAAAAQKIVDSPKATQGILSALLCNATYDRAATLAEIAKDRKYSRIGGAVNLSRRAELQDDLAAEDDSIARIRTSLRGIKKPALSCKLPIVSAIAGCLSDDPDDRGPECSSPEGEAMVRASEMLER